jgi:RimJ/RimL family protein N-acetyltransferase
MFISARQGDRDTGLSADTFDWRAMGLPVLSNESVTLREVELGDAPSLHEQLTQGNVHAYIDPPPHSVVAFRRFILWTRAQRRKGRHLSYGAVPPGQTTPIGVLQLWKPRDGATAEWGLAIGEDYWGTGLAVAASRLLLDFAVGTVGARRLEALASVDNDRANGLLAKLGARRECTRQVSSGEITAREEVLWSIAAEQWAGPVKV